MLFQGETHNGWIQVPYNVDLIAVVLMEAFGAVSFFVAILFFRQRQLMKDKQKAFLDAVNKLVVSDNGDGKCYSSEWIMDNIVYKPKKALNATPLFLLAFTFLFAVFYYMIGPHLFTNIASFGYAGVIALLAIAVLLWTDAFEAYGYSRAIHEVSVEQLDKEDQSYIELAKDSLGKGFQRFVSLGVAFALIGPFIPQIFNSVVYAFTLYTSVFFQASGWLFKVFTVLGAAVVLVLPVLMFFLPELLAKIVVRRLKPLAKRILKTKSN